jgi:hypothetical protein
MITSPLALEAEAIWLREAKPTEGAEKTAAGWGTEGVGILRTLYAGHNPGCK